MTHRANGIQDSSEHLPNVLDSVEAGNSVEHELDLSRSQLKRLERDFKVAQEQHQKEIQTLLVDHGRTLSRLAAALTHELNSPLAALMSSLQTLSRLSPQEKRKRLAPDRREKLQRIGSKLSRNVFLAADRLQQVVRRIERLGAPEDGALLSVDLNSLLRDVVDIVAVGDQGKVEIKVVCGPLPLVPLRPRQISKVLLDVLQDAVDSVGQEGRILMTTRLVNSHLEIMVVGDRRTPSDENLGRTFDPCFKVQNGHIVAGNWDLFGSRQVMVGHGGSIRVETAPRGGTVRTGQKGNQSQRFKNTPG